MSYGEFWALMFLVLVIQAVLFTFLFNDNGYYEMPKSFNWFGVLIFIIITLPFQVIRIIIKISEKVFRVLFMKKQKIKEITAFKKQNEYDNYF